MPHDAANSRNGHTTPTLFGWPLERSGETADSLGYTPLLPGLVGLVKDSAKR
jgi:hypothetical protein